GEDERGVGFRVKRAAPGEHDREHEEPGDHGAADSGADDGGGPRQGAEAEAPRRLKSSQQGVHGRPARLGGLGEAARDRAPEPGWDAAVTRNGGDLDRAEARDRGERAQAEHALEERDAEAELIGAGFGGAEALLLG